MGVLAGWFGAFWVESCRLRKSMRAKIAAEFMVTQRSKGAKKDKEGKGGLKIMKQELFFAPLLPEENQNNNEARQKYC